MSAYATALKESSKEARLEEALRQHDRAEKAEKELAAAQAVILHCEEDINWMMNNEKLLNPEVFKYLHDAVEKLEVPT